MKNIAPAKSACVLIIGNEILSGRTQDQNLSFIGKRCDELGISLSAARVIPDVEEVIISVVGECRDNYDYVFTTGGIGPTHDDITTSSIAKLFNVELQRSAKAVAAMNKYYDTGMLNEARLKMADIPIGGILIDNPISGAPGIQMENIFILPGVPMIMQAMFDGIIDRLTKGPPVLTVSVTTNLTEGLLADGMGHLQDKYPDLSIGSYPFFKHGKLGVNIVMRSTDEVQIKKVTEQLRKLIFESGGEVFT